MIRRLLLVVGLLVLAGCGTSAPASPLPEVRFDPPSQVPAPTAVTIPAIDAHSTLIPLGLTPEGALEVPPVDAPWQAGWFSPGPEPGQTGPAVVVGHVDGVVDGQKGQPGIFHDLHRLAAGDEVLVDRADGSQLRFVVERVESHDKDTFPTQAVYGDTDGPELRLITCGGTFDREAGHYQANIIVWAVLA